MIEGLSREKCRAAGSPVGCCTPLLATARVFSILARSAGAARLIRLLSISFNGFRCTTHLVMFLKPPGSGAGWYRRSGWKDSIENQVDCGKIQRRARPAASGKRSPVTTIQSRQDTDWRLEMKHGRAMRESAAERWWSGVAASSRARCVYDRPGLHGCPLLGLRALEQTVAAAGRQP